MKKQITDLFKKAPSEQIECIKQWAEQGEKWMVEDHQTLIRDLSQDFFLALLESKDLSKESGIFKFLFKNPEGIISLNRFTKNPIVNLSFLRALTDNSECPSSSEIQKIAVINLLPGCFLNVINYFLLNNKGFSYSSVSLNEKDIEYLLKKVKRLVSKLENHDYLQLMKTMNDQFNCGNDLYRLSCFLIPETAELRKVRHEQLDVEQQIQLFIYSYSAKITSISCEDKLLESYRQGISDLFIDPVWANAIEDARIELMSHLKKHSLSSFIFKEIFGQEKAFNNLLAFLEKQNNKTELYQIGFVSFFVEWCKNLSEPKIDFSHEEKTIPKLLTEMIPYKENSKIYQALLAVIGLNYYLYIKRKTERQDAAFVPVWSLKQKTKDLADFMYQGILYLRPDYEEKKSETYVFKEIEQYSDPTYQAILKAYSDTVILTTSKLKARLETIHELSNLAQVVREYRLSRIVEGSEHKGFSFFPKPHKSKTVKLKDADLLIQFSQGQISLEQLSSEAFKEGRLALIYDKAVELSTKSVEKNSPVQASPIDQHSSNQEIQNDQEHTGEDEIELTLLGY